MASLVALELKLRDLSHSDEAIDAIQTFAGQLRNTSERAALFNPAGAILRAPIERADASVLGFDSVDDEFALLQGDVISTESAYFFGERITGNPKYVVLNPSCDLVVERANSRVYVSLLRVSALSRNDPKVKEKLNLLLQFRRKDALYLPPLPSDPEMVIGNVIQFDGICQIRLVELAFARRLASLTLVGWRIFGSFARAVFARATSREVHMRTAIENHPIQEGFPFDSGTN